MRPSAFLNGIFVFSMLLAFSFCISSFLSANRCYITPCEEGSGLDVLWKVRNGLGFQVVFSGLVFLGYSLFGIYVFSKDKAGEYWGFLFSSTIVLACLAIETAVIWGSERLMMDDLPKGPYTESQRTSVRNDDCKGPFSGCAALSAILFVCYLLILFLLLRLKTDLVYDTYEIKDDEAAISSNYANYQTPPTVS